MLQQVKKPFLLFQMCYDHHVFVALEELKGCYELWGSWVLDLKPTQQHIIRPLTQCMACSACEASTRAYATLFMYVQRFRLIPLPPRGAKKAVQCRSRSLNPIKKKKKHIRKSPMITK